MVTYPHSFSVFDYVPTGICIFNCSLKIIFWNRQLELWTGRRSRDVVGTPVTALTTKLKDPIYGSRFASLFEGGPPIVLSPQLHRNIFPSPNNSTTRLFQTIISPLSQQLEGGPFALMSVQDVTNLSQKAKKYRLMRDLATTKEQEALELANATSSFLAKMSHEIRNPLNGVLGALELALEEDPSPAVKEYLEIAYTSSEVLRSLITDILDLSKLESDKLELCPSPCEINSLMEKVAASIKVKTIQGNIEFLVEISDRLPKAFMVDQLRLSQILINLLSNAFKFTPEGGAILLYITDAVSADGAARIRFSVIDSGIGIKREALPTLFDEYQQASPDTAQKFGGTGLGLTISKEIVRLMGGELQLKSESGIGTALEFDIPLLEAELELKNSEPRSEELLATTISPGVTVLLVEDNLLNQRVAQRLLEKAGVTVQTAVNGAEAIQQFESREFDLILMDCQMPILDGFEATESIRKLQIGSEHRIPIIAVTANATTQDREKCLQAGMDDFLSKPYTKDSLLRMIAQWSK